MRFFDALSIGGTCSVFGTAVGVGAGIRELVVVSALVGWILFVVATVAMTEVGTAALRSAYPDIPISRGVFCDADKERRGPHSR